MAAKSFRIREYDDADNVVATYVQSLGSEKESRVDVIVCPCPICEIRLAADRKQRPGNSQSFTALWSKTLDVFLPVGFPHSVTDDYLE